MSSNESTAVEGKKFLLDGPSSNRYVFWLNTDLFLLWKVTEIYCLSVYRLHSVRFLAVVYVFYQEQTFFFSSSGETFCSSTIIEERASKASPV